VNVTIKQIVAFLTVAEFGSFTRAGERLKIAQPALSQAIRDLERELGLRLFDRTTRRVELTEGGREFRDATAKIVDDLDFAVRSVHDLAGRRRGRVVVAAPPLLAAAILPSAMVDFARLYPGVQVTILDAPTREIVESVRSGRAEYGLGTFAPGEPGIERVRLARDELLLFCRPDHPFASQANVTWKALSEESMITLTRDSGIRRLLEIGFESAQIALTPAFEVAQIATILALVQAGLGVAVLPAYAHAEAAARHLVSRPMVAPKIARDIVLVHATGRSLSPAAVALQPILRSCARRLAPRAGDGDGAASGREPPASAQRPARKRRGA
jgi:DNA-binding transcriptional LysR family regulator